MESTIQKLRKAFLPLFPTVKVFFVGGCVRDELQGLPCDDIDFAIAGADFNTVLEIVKPLASHVTQEAVGSSLAVVKATVDGLEFDFALCRGEKPSGQSHKDFDLTFGVTIEDDLLRRDLTINAIAKCLQTGEIIDPFGGAEDLKNGIAREVSPHFAEDPLRVLRAARFCARFNLTPSQSLIDLCKTLSPDNLSAERFGKELWKTMKQAPKPSIFFHFLKEVGWLSQVFPELSDLIDVVQSAKHHPEGDAFIHTMHCMDFAKDPFTRVVMMCHDLGKATTTVIKDGKITAHGHEKASVPLADALLSRVKLESEEGFGGRKSINKVLLLTELHMLHGTPNIGDKKLIEKVLRLNKSGLTFNDLVLVLEADVSGRPPLPQGKDEAILSLESRVHQLIEERDFLNPIVTGKLLLEAGLSPGPKLGQKIQQAHILQCLGRLNKDNWKSLLGL